jgi:Holliday junction resolvase
LANKQYRAGRVFEYDMMHIFEQKNYCVERTAGSHGSYDVIAHNDLEVIVIQCKKENKKTNYKLEIEKLRDAKFPFYVIRLFAVKCEGVVKILNVDSMNKYEYKLKDLVGADDWLCR